MNCKPGDLAVVVRVRKPFELPYLGRVLRCVHIGTWGEFPCWVVDPPVPGFDEVADFCLRPINNPGEDAKDETLSWLPVPLPQLETA